MNNETFPNATDSKYNYFNELNTVNVSDKVEKKNGLSYLSWAWAWGELKKLHPTANYKVYENEQGWNYFTDGKTGWVKTGVTVDGLEHIEYLPIMDFRNKSIPLEQITSFEVNKTIQRSLTKAVARHGLGLYIYAGEDLPEDHSAYTPHKQAEPKDDLSTNTAHLSQDTLKALELFNVDINKVATHLKKDVCLLTDKEVMECVEQKRQIMQKKAEKTNG